MNLRDYLDAKTPAARRQFAAEIGTTPAYLNQLRYGCKQAGPVLAQKINKASKGAVPLHELRADIWPRRRAA